MKLMSKWMKYCTHNHQIKRRLTDRDIGYEENNNNSEHNEQQPNKHNKSNLSSYLSSDILSPQNDNSDIEIVLMIQKYHT